VNELYPQQGGPNPIYTTGQYGYPYFGGFGQQMPGYGPTPNPQVESRLDKIEKFLEKMTGGDNQNPELDAKQAELEAVKAQLQDEKEKRQEDRERRRDEQTSQLMQQLQQQNEQVPKMIEDAYAKANREHELRETALARGREEGLKAKSGDFEGRVLDIVENQAAPAFIGELREGRKLLQGIAGKIQPASDTEASQEPISEDEAARISEAMLIEETMRAMAAKGKHTEVPRPSKEAVSE